MAKTAWLELERLFAELDREVAELLNPAEREEVMSFVQANEFGLALETFIDICAEQNKKPSDPARGIVIEIATTMKVSPGPLLARLP